MRYGLDHLSFHSTLDRLDMFGNRSTCPRWSIVESSRHRKKSNSVSVWSANHELDQQDVTYIIDRHDLLSVDPTVCIGVIDQNQNRPTMQPRIGSYHGITYTIEDMLLLLLLRGRPKHSFLHKHSGVKLESMINQWMLLSKGTESLTIHMVRVHRKSQRAAATPASGSTEAPTESIKSTELSLLNQLLNHFKGLQLDLEMETVRDRARGGNNRKVS